MHSPVGHTTKPGHPGLEIINLSSVSLTDDQIYVLKLRLTFWPSTNIDRFQLVKDIHLFARRLLFKVIYDRPPSCESVDFPPLDFSEAELQAMDNLMLLWEEGHTDDSDDPLDLPVSGVVVSRGCLSPHQPLSSQNHVIFP